MRFSIQQFVIINHWLDLFCFSEVFFVIYVLKNLMFLPFPGMSKHLNSSLFSAFSKSSHYIYNPTINHSKNYFNKFTIFLVLMCCINYFPYQQKTGRTSKYLLEKPSDPLNQTKKKRKEKKSVEIRLAQQICVDLSFHPMLIVKVTELNCLITTQQN